MRNSSITKSAFLGEAATLWATSSLLGKLGLGAAAAAGGYGVKKLVGALGRRIGPRLERWRVGRMEKAYRSHLSAADDAFRRAPDLHELRGQIANAENELARLKAAVGNNPSVAARSNLEGYVEQIRALKDRERGMLDQLNNYITQARQKAVAYATYIRDPSIMQPIQELEQRFRSLKFGIPEQQAQSGFFNRPAVKWGLIGGGSLLGGWYLGKKFFAPQQTDEIQQVPMPTVQQRW